MKHLLLIPLLALAGCASTGRNADAPPVDVSGAEVTRRTMDNGDIKVTPARGAPFYLYDRNGDGRMDNDKDGVSPVYWKLYSW